MHATKKVNDHYYIASPEVTITGNLTVSGAQASVTSTDSVITDRQIVLNNGEAGAGITGQLKSGIEVDRGTLDNAILVFDEADDRWKISTDGGATYRFILSTTSASGGTDVVSDTTPQLGGNLEIDGFNIQHAGDNVSMVFDDEGFGDSGVYMTNDTVTTHELVTMKKAKLIAYVLG